MRRAFLALLLLVDCATTQDTPEVARVSTEVAPVSPRAIQPASVPAGEPWLGVFPAYPGARYLCSQSVSGSPMHITWSSYATADTPERVRAFYERGPAPQWIDRSSGFRLVGPDRKIVSVHARDESYPQCEVPPTAADKTVFIVSQASQ